MTEKKISIRLDPGTLNKLKWIGFFTAKLIIE